MMPETETNLTSDELIREAERLAQVAAESAPSILALSRHRADVERAAAAYDRAQIRNLGTPEAHRLTRAMHLLSEREQALEALIVTLPPATPQEAVALLHAGAAVAEDLDANELSSDEMKHKAGVLARVLFGAAPGLIPAVGLDAATMEWGTAGDIRARRWYGTAAAPVGGAT